MNDATLVAVADVLLNRLKPTWHADALCREYPTLDWFPQTGSHPVAATAVCRRCLVSKECLAAACDNHEAGVWGGTTQLQRVRLRRQNATHSTAAQFASDNNAVPQTGQLTLGTPRN